MISQSTDDLTRAELRAIRGHYTAYDKTRRAPLVCVATRTSWSWSARGTGGSGGHRGLGARSSATTCRSHGSATRLSSARLR